jgi:enoyl-CoA hydratase
MGGGVGLSRPCRFRVATERPPSPCRRAASACSRTSAAGWYLSRCPTTSGLWLALSGARIKAADCELLQIATDYVESAELPS